jgi:hypothetical protein
VVPSPAAPVAVPAASVFEPRSRALLISVWVLAIVALGLLAALLILMFNQAKSEAVIPEKTPAVARTFWRAFIDGSEHPWVVFSNAAFIGRPETGMRYFDSHRDSPSTILDHYTGVGEVLAIHELDTLFSSFRHGIRVKRGRLLSLDDAMNNDLIFIGSPSENLSLRDMPSTREFVFGRVASGPRAGDLQIVNLNPRTGEAASFIATPGVPLLEDYALVGLIPGMNPRRWIMILAGTSTIGTQAAAEFVTRDKSTQELVDRAGTTGGLMRPFEGVIQVKVNGGVPVASELVALHTRQ